MVACFYVEHCNTMWCRQCKDCGRCRDSGGGKKYHLHGRRLSCRGPSARRSRGNQQGSSKVHQLKLTKAKSRIPKKPPGRQIVVGLQLSCHKKPASSKVALSLTLPRMDQGWTKIPGGRPQKIAPLMELRRSQGDTSPKDCIPPLRSEDQSQRLKSSWTQDENPRRRTHMDGASQRLCSAQVGPWPGSLPEVKLS